MKKTSFYLAAAATFLAVCVVMLGAYTRLVHAGLGCPDWPTCYGHVWVPNTESEIAIANQKFAQTPVEVHKTWPEQTHRMFASSLGLLTLVLFILAVKKRDKNHPWISITVLLIILIGAVIARIIIGDKLDVYLWGIVALYFLNLLRLSILFGASDSPFKLPSFIAGFIILQGFFGMWTVTLKLWPQVVTLHLLGGFTTLATLFLLALRLKIAPYFLSPSMFTLWQPYKKWAAMGLILVCAQIFLGGWTSANYAAVACIDLPTCHGAWVPNMDWRSGFNIFQEIGPNYLGGVMDSDARTAIHYAHRLGAVTVTLFTLGFILMLWPKTTDTPLRAALIMLGLVLLIQISLGLSNIWFFLPLPVAVAHNLGGAILLLMWVNVNYRLRNVRVEKI